MKALTFVWFLALILAVSGCGKDNAAAPAASPSVAAWTPGQINDATTGCMTTAHSQKPDLSFQIVESYCTCMVTAASKLWTADDFQANATADAQTLAANGTTAGCKAQAGVQ